MVRSRATVVGVAAVVVAVASNSMRMANGHIEDICIEPGGSMYNQHGHEEQGELSDTVQPFYKAGQAMGCEYDEWTPRCLAAALSPQILRGFNDTSACRGFVHFFSVYAIAAAQGFKRDYAYFIAAFSQAIDFMQYRAVDSCGNDMDLQWWTPPMRGFLRTNTKLGGTQRHLGLPYVGFFSGEYLSEEAKTYTGAQTAECHREHFTQSFEYYAARCPGLRPDLEDPFYEGALSSARLWAFGKSDLLCIGGFTSIGEDGSPFTGDSCPQSGTTESVNIGPAVSGPIPLAGGSMMLGEQYVNYECEPACACDGSCTDNNDNENYNMTNIVKAREMGAYLAAQEPYARIDGEPVPEVIARFGIYLHWVADRASHWYCCDSPQTGISIANKTDNHNYNLNMYMSETACNFVGHSMEHMLEQGMNPRISPGSYTALSYTYSEMEAFKKDMLSAGHSDWFDSEVSAHPVPFDTLIGTNENPAALVLATMEPHANDRVSAFMRVLKEFNLPALPGFETSCSAAQADSQGGSLRATLLQGLSGW